MKVLDFKLTFTVKDFFLVSHLMHFKLLNNKKNYKISFTVKSIRLNLFDII